MKRSRTGVFVGLLLVLSAAPVRGQSADGIDPRLQAEVRTLSTRIDGLINNRLREASVRPAPPADDSHFYRRLNLDLVGRIPDPIDARGYVEDTSPDKRWLWVERLLESDEFLDHFANVFRAHLITNEDNFQVRAFVPAFEQWLKQKLRDNTSYDKMVREILTGGPNVMAPQQFALGVGNANPSTAAFYFANENKPENLAGASARLFLGVKLECAQCHAHPFAKWTRNQFWELAAFFNGANQPFVRVNAAQPVRPPGRREIMIPGTKKVVKAKFLDGKEPAWKNNDDSRAVLANWITARDNPYFARAAVDMLWQYFFGVSLVEPIMEPGDTSIAHPQLLDELARQFVAHNYDLKYIIRAIVHTQAYQRTSEVQSEPNPDELLLFARMPVRGMSPEQFFASIALATDYRAPVPYTGMNQPFFNQPTTVRGEFIAKFTSSEKRTETSTSILQALFMMNGKFLTQRTKLNPNMTVAMVGSMTSERTGAYSREPEINLALHSIVLNSNPVPQKLKDLYLLVLSRYPTPPELSRMMHYVESGGPRHDQRQALADVYWALLNSGEFMLIH
jgi:hypothetical protein